MSPVDCIANIQDLIDGWRQLGSRRLHSGVELIARLPDDEEDTWLHAIFPALDTRGIARLERALGVPLPRQLRSFYRACGGMSLFGRAFLLHGLRGAGVHTGERALQPEDVVQLNHELDALDWKPAGAIAFASNSWDNTVHLTGMGRTPNEIVRCERQGGRVLETHPSLFECVEARLYRLDRLSLR